MGKPIPKVLQKGGMDNTNARVKMAKERAKQKINNGAKLVGEMNDEHGLQGVDELLKQARQDSEQAIGN